MDPEELTRKENNLDKTTVEISSEKLIGQRLADRYVIRTLIGQGGMGRVFLAEDTRLGNKKVAIKLLQPSVASNPEVVNRFIQEARAVNQIRSRYIVDIFSFGKLLLHFLLLSDAHAE